MRLCLAVVIIAAGLGWVSPGAGAERGDRPIGRCVGVSEASGTRHDSRPLSARNAGDCLRINQIQVIGTHNSYRQAITPEIFDVITLLDPVQAQELEYEHVPLAEQLESQGVRQIELDIFADPDGGYLAERKGLDALGLPNETPPELLEPGFKVLHGQEVDFNSSCLTFVICLEQVREWSNTNRGHLPITVLVEMKEGSIPDPLNLGFLTAIPFDEELLDDVDNEILSVFSRRDVITPDVVRGDYPTLDAAVRSGNWPTLNSARGKVMFVIDNSGMQDMYTAGHPSLQQRMMFTNAEPGDPDAAFVKANEAPGNVGYIQSLVADGYVVRTRADTPTFEARSGDTTRRDAALASGAQWVSTDYPLPGISQWSDYYASIPDGDPARCNPINTGPRCENSLLETSGRHGH
ncbi:MAG: phosphatidylinositol-specific phospholipase C1-like protein [Acidobacteria bacterium]|nr:phosphatidylinositol-specific phospholipase C1-like protein [Acidobacteriota bacterium]